MLFEEIKTTKGEEFVREFLSFSCDRSFYSILEGKLRHWIANDDSSWRLHKRERKVSFSGYIQLGCRSLFWFLHRLSRILNEWKCLVIPLDTIEYPAILEWQKRSSRVISLFISFSSVLKVISSLFFPMSSISFPYSWIESVHLPNGRSHIKEKLHKDRLDPPTMPFYSFLQYIPFINNYRLTVFHLIPCLSLLLSDALSHSLLSRWSFIFILLWLWMSTAISMSISLSAHSKSAYIYLLEVYFAK